MMEMMGLKEMLVHQNDHEIMKEWWSKCNLQKNIRDHMNKLLNGLVESFRIWNKLWSIITCQGFCVVATQRMLQITLQISRSKPYKGELGSSRVCWIKILLQYT